MAIEWRAGTIVGRTVWSEGLFTLTTEVEGVAPFEPGQFLQVGMQINGERVYRPYSVASPHGSRLEFYIVVVEGGGLTPHLWRAEIGSPIELSERAAGSFTLAKAPVAENLWLIATGTGLAPYVAMLRTSRPWETYRRIIVVHGVRYQSDFGYRDEFAAYAAAHPGQLVFLPAVTREEAADGILHGRIPACLASGTLEQAAGCELRADNSAVMLCGNPAMLDEMEQALTSRGMKRHRSKAPGHIVVERYW